MAPMRTIALGFGIVVLLGAQADGAPLRVGRAIWWMEKGWDGAGPNAAVPESVRGLIDPAFLERAAQGPQAWPAGAISNSPVVGQPAFAPTSSFAPPATPVPASPVRAYTYDAYINMGEGPYAGASTLTTGGAGAWYNSPVVQRVYGGPPSPADRAQFTSAVLEQVENAYAQSGIPISLTSSAWDQAAHSLSVVSGTSYGDGTDAIGITTMGGDGFSFIDKLGHANSVGELEVAVANNVAHELMHAFGVGHHDTTGQFLDAAVTDWSVLADPNATLGPEAVAELMAQDFNLRTTGDDQSWGHHLAHPGSASCPNCARQAMMLAPSPVPEPTTIAIWAVGLAAAYCQVRRRRRAA